MAVGHRLAAIVCLLALSGVLPSISQAGELAAEIDFDLGLFRCSALIAHVRVAGAISSARKIEHHDGDDEPLWLVEILDAAQGPAAGELVIVETRGARLAAEHFRTGATFLLFATREIDGVYRPLPDDGGVWPIDSAGKLATHRYAQLLPPSVDATKPSDVTAWLWNEAQQHAFDVSIALDQDDLKNFDARRPLRLAITVENTGGRPLSINNAIEFEYDARGDELMEEKRHFPSLPEVKIYARPLQREHVLSDMERMLQQQSELTLSPGEGCAAQFDLGQEPQIYGGMRYQLWVEVGGRVSRPIVFKTPGGHEELALEKLAEFEGDGPFRKIARDAAPRHAMPDVEATDQSLAIQAALRAWLTEKPRRGDEPAQKSHGCEIVLLSRALLSPDFVGAHDGVRFVTVDRFLAPTDRPSQFQLRETKATFRSRMLRVEKLAITKQTARVVICDVEDDDESGLLAIVRLVRERGEWRADGEIKLAIH